MTHGGYRARLLALFLLLHAPAALALEGQDPAPDRSLARSVFAVQAGHWRGLGFLVDPAGLVVTGYELGRGADPAVVRLDERRRVAGETLVLDKRSRTAILRLAPDVVAGLEPLPLSEDSESRPREGDVVLVARGGASGAGPHFARAPWPRSRWARLARDLGLDREDGGGPILDSGGSVIAVNLVLGPGDAELPWGVPIGRVLPALRRARERAAGRPPPPAGEWTALEAVAPPFPGSAAGARERGRRFADYRIRAGEWNVEFLTPPLLDSLLEDGFPSSIAGEVPWQWQRRLAAGRSVVTVQVVPDLRWTGGSYARVAGRVVSYPLLAVALLGLTIGAGLSGGHAGEFFSGTEPLWAPARAAYHFKGDFLEARLLRDGAAVGPITGLRTCETTEAWLARRPAQKPRWRTIRGCWGTYTYPAAAFEPGHALELRLLEEREEDDPAVVPVPAAIVERIRADFQPAPRAASPPAP